MLSWGHAHYKTKGWMSVVSNSFRDPPLDRDVCWCAICFR